MNDIARRKIQAILDGKKASSVKDTSGFSQKPSEDNSVGNAQEFAEMNNNSEETDEDYYTYEEPSYEENDEYYYQPEEPAEYDYSEDYAGQETISHFVKRWLFYFLYVLRYNKEL